MSRLPTLTGEFVLGSDPELRFTPTGKAVCNLSVKATESKKTDTGWEDGDSTPWITVTLWDQWAEEAANSLRSGQRVLVTGLLYARTYQRRDGGDGTSIELKWATVAPVLSGKKSERSSGYSDDPWTTPRTDGGTTHHVPDDPWATPASQEEPPF